jgi:formate hydrogenlyase transcriptional activator
MFKTMKVTARTLSSPAIHISSADSNSLAFERLISDICSCFANPDPVDIDALLDDSLQEIIECLGIDRAALFLEEFPGRKRFILTNLKVRPGCEPSTKPDLTTDSFPWMFEQYLQGRETKFSCIDELPAEAAVDKETLRTFGPKYSSMAVPLFNGDRVYGILGLGVAKQTTWPEELAPRLRVLAHVLSASLLRLKTEQKLQRTLNELEHAKTNLERESVYRRPEVGSHRGHKIVYQSRVVEAMLEQARQVANTHATVLLTGETGTGKEMLASAIHEMSLRNKRPMVRVNCGAIPAALVESEMFGREKGAYTGALSRQIGRFELAHGSTIFLDEITDIPMEVQVKLLRVLQEKEIERLGNPKPIHVDVRVIAATNQSLEKAVDEGKFRQDLFYRLNVFPIDVPPLRERREDIPMLVCAFVDELCDEFGKKVESISQKSMEALTRYSWPGNVRELRNTIERAMIVSNSPNLIISVPNNNSNHYDYRTMTLKETEIRHIRQVLENVGWKIRGKGGAAEILGMKPTTLETRMAKLEIVRPRKNK